MLTTLCIVIGIFIGYDDLDIVRRVLESVFVIVQREYTQRNELYYIDRDIF